MRDAADRIRTKKTRCGREEPPAAGPVFNRREEEVCRLKRPNLTYPTQNRRGVCPISGLLVALGRAGAATAKDACVAICAPSCKSPSTISVN
jgi:hypothetical protein